MKKYFKILMIFCILKPYHYQMPPYIPFPPAPIVSDFYPESLLRMGLIIFAIVGIQTFLHFQTMWLPQPIPPPVSDFQTLTFIFNTHSLNNCYIYVNLIWQQQIMNGPWRFPWLIIHKLMGFKLIPISILNPLYVSQIKKEFA